jgi:hypothetical protein
MIMAKITATSITEHLCLPASLVKGLHQAHRTSFHISPSKYSPTSLRKLSKAILGLFVATLFYFTPPKTQAQNPSYSNGTILVKFKANSSIFTAWERNGRRGTIPSLQTVLSAHTSEALFDDGLISGVIERFSRLTEDDPAKRTATLTRWCKIRFSAKINAVFLASKLKNLPDVEYAEPLYYRTLTDAPNDPFTSSQQYLRIIRAFEAWDVVRLQVDTSQRIIVGIVDSGVDYNHEDLAANIYINPGESGMDAQGRDKRTNGIDDDRNGRVDDWHGWNFAADADGNENNDPMPIGNTHGTHVAGIAGAVTNNNVGVAGTARGIWLLPVKCSPPGSTLVPVGFRGIIYAAVMGAKIINCSWGDISRSQAEQDAVNIATELGSLIISTAGNDRRYTAFYPGSYDNTCSVAWLEDDDTRLAGNYHETVDIGAPGTNIYATFADNRYGSQSGTSMAAPMVSAAATLVKMRFPQLSPRQILSQLKATADNNDRLNPDMVGLIGTGRLNMLAAVQTVNPPFIEVRSYTVQDENNNGLLESGERVTIQLNLANGFAAVAGARISMRTTIATNSAFYPFFDDTLRQVPNLAANEARTGAVNFSFRLTTMLSQDFTVPLLFSITDANGKLIGRDALTLSVNTSFQTLRGNALRLTVNSRGSFGFNDFPTNMQGDGLLYQPRDTNNLIYEGGLIVVSGADSISSSVRDTPTQRDKAFLANSLLSLSTTPDSSLLTARTSFADRAASNQAGVSVDQTLQQYRQSQRQNMVISSYIITNTSSRAFSELYAGLFFDWDIGNYSVNETFWDSECGCGIAKSSGGDFPVIGVKLLSPQKPTFYPITLGDTAQNVITLENGFSRSDKYRSLSSGISSSRKSGDIAHVVGASGMTLQPTSSVLVRFAIAGGLSLDEIRTSFRALTQADSASIRLYPNPTSNNAFLEYELTGDQVVTVELINSLGQVVATPLSRQQSKGWQQTSFALDALSSGLYWVRLRGASLSFSKPLLISR